MRKFILITMMGIVSQTYATNSQSFQENSNLEITLSQANYNRLVVKGDKITKVHFPEGSMAVKGEEDGSLYVMVAKGSPFTLFLTTDQGHHFSATVKSENALGKTLEFIPLTETKVIASHKTQATTLPYFTTLIDDMMNQKTPAGYTLKRHFGQTIRLQQGLVLLPKKTYEGIQFNGEVLEVYNGRSQPIELKEAWFAEPSVKAVALSEQVLSAKGRALVYRVMERRHG